MAEITQTQWKRYIARLRRINDAAADEFRSYVISKGGYDNIDRQTLIDYAYAIATKYGEASAAVSAQMYDAVAEFSGAAVPAAIPAETATYSEVAKTVNGIIKNTGSEEVLAQGIGRLVKMAGTDTMLSNAHRDRSANSKRHHSGAEVAWIPSGDTCPFCITLASKGWQKQTKWAANNHSEHIHANCDCTYMVRFDKNFNVEGYDPDKYYEEYHDADGETSKEKINSMRRMQYQDPAIRNKIREQQREAYTLKTEVHSIKRNDTTVWEGKVKENSKAEINALRNYAEKKGIVLDKSFESFDGDLSLAKDFIDTMDANINSSLHMRNKPVKISVSYTMDDTDYAETKGSNVFINGFAYRDRELLEADYNKKVSERWFTQGSTYLDISTHESAHVIIYIDQLKTKDVIETIFGKNQKNASDLIVKNISEYAAENRDELIAESYVAYKNGSNNEYVLKVLQHCGIIK